MTGKLLDGLNDAQRRAVTSTAPVILCLAGAGSGKTRTLTSRVAYLHQEHRVGTSNMLCLTFTRLAGKEMKERIMKLIGEEPGKKLFCNTFHAFAVSVLRDWGFKIGIEKNFTIYDQDDRKAIMDQIINEFGKKTSYSKTVEIYLSPKPEVWINNPEELRVITEYEYRLRQNNAVDLDLLIRRVNFLWVKHPEVCKEYQRAYTQVFVDEFQDTSDDQMEMLRLLNPSNLFVVGDDFQAIYGWRGARVNYIIDFPEQHPECEVSMLEDNYRSTSAIVKAANQLITRNERQTKKILIAHKDGLPVVTFETETEAEESSAIVNQIRSLYGAVRFSDMAVLARTNDQIDRMKGFMDEMGIPAIRVSGKDDPFRKHDIKLLLAWLDFIYNKRDDFNLKKILAFPDQYVTPNQLQQLEFDALSGDTSLLEALTHSKHAGKFMFLIAAIEQEMADCKATPSKYFKIIVRILQMEGRYKAQGLDNRLQDAERAFSYMWHWEQSKITLGEDYSIQAFLKWLRYRDIQERLAFETKDAVKLMTAHAAKGLEFDTVFVIGMNQDTFPSKNTQDLEEERRLFYVAITRAKERLYISRAKQIEGWGGAVKETKASRFIEEMSA